MPEPRRVVVTGAAGRLGRVILDRLVRAPEIDRVVALDLRPPAACHPKVEPVTGDVRDPEVGRHFAGCDTLIHLAFVVERGSRDPRRTDSINVGGTENALRAAVDAGFGTIVHASSIAAYGFHPDNEAGPLGEEAPIRGNDDFYYARTKAVTDRWVTDLAAAHPDVAVAILRPSIFLGPRGNGRLRPFHGRLFPHLTGGSDPPTHVTHEDDVAEAFFLALSRRARGAFNIATDDPLPVSAWAGNMGMRTMPIPAGALSLADLAYRAHLIDVSPEWLRVGRRYPLVVSSARARRQLRWHPRYPTTGAVLRALAGRPHAAASRGTRILFGTLATITRVRGSLPVDERARQELRAFDGSANLVFTGAHPSEWHVRFAGGRIGVYRGIDPSARATTSMKEEVFFRLLDGELSYARANMTGKIRHHGEGNMSMIVGAIVGGFRQAASAEGRAAAPARVWGRLVMRNGPERSTSR